MPRLWLLSAGLVVLAGCVHRSPDVPDTPPGPRITVMTYNVNFGLAGDRAGIDAIREGGADVVLLQETTPAWEQALRRELAATYPHMAFRHCCRAGGLAVLSRFAFEHADYEASQAGLFPAWRIIAHTPLGPVQMLNLHLRPPISDSGSVVSGYFTTRPVRQREMVQFHALLAPDTPAIIAGDFNEDHSGNALRYLTERGYRDPQGSAGPATWRWKTSIGTLRSTLDHILHDDALVAVDSRVIRRGRSDHMPVIVTFAAREP